MATKLNYSLDLEAGSSQYAYVAYNSAFNPNNYTLEAWVCLESTGITAVIASTDPTSAKGFAWYIGTDNKPHLVHQGVADVNATTALSAGVWYHLAVAYNGTRAYFYLNDVPDGDSALADFTNTDAEFMVGANNSDAPANYFDGKLRDVRFWSDVRTQAEIATFSHQTVSSESNLIGEWRFENNLNDSSANAFNLTGVNSPSYASTPEDVPFTYYLGSGDNLTSLDLEAGSSQYAYITDANQTGLDLTGDFTFETWANFESTPSSGNTMQFLSKDDNTAGDRSYQWSLWNDSGTLKIAILIFAGDSTYDLVTWNHTPTTGVWTHYGVTCDVSNAASTEFELFINGVSQGNGTVVTNGNVSTIQSGSANFEIGRLGNSSGYFDGKIHFVRVFSDIRSSSEIKTDMTTKSVTDANLVGEWGFEGNALDNTTNNNDLTLVNSPYYSPDVAFDVNARHSLDLELGSSQYASITDALQTGLAITGSMSIECWVKFESIPDDTITFVSKYQTTGNQVSYLFCLAGGTPNDQLAFLYSTDGSYQAANDARVTWNPSLDTWYHIAVIFDATNSTVKFYVNGSQQGSDVDTTGTSIYDSTTDIGVGSSAYGGWSDFLDGKLKEVRVWNDVRTEAEISANKDKQLVGNEANLVANWRLNNNYVDLTTNNNNLTPVNSPVFTRWVPFDGEAISTFFGTNSRMTLLGVGI